MANKAIEIIYSDENLLVINKPSGISVTKDRGGDIDLLDALSKQDKNYTELRLIHRLDKLTSGVMILAKNPETQSKYSSLFEKREVKKTYLLLATGFAGKTKGIVRTPLGRDRKDPTKMRFDKHGKRAITQWSVLADFGFYILIKAEPVTGRTHQIRVHMKEIGLPLAVDPLYGGTRPILLSDVKMRYNAKRGVDEKPLIDRLTLHAYQLQLPGFETPFIAELDNNFAATIKMLHKHNPKGSQAEIEAGIIAKIVEAQPI
jgi:RluA family pseudouridine synthase